MAISGSDVKELGEWNPMIEDYNDFKFNCYTEGPGVGLNRPAEVNTENEQMKYPYMVVKNMPPNMKTNALFNLCSQYGRVRDIPPMGKKPFIFVYFETISDLEAAYRRLKTNSYGFQVFLGKEKHCTTEIGENASAADSQKPMVNMSYAPTGNRFTCPTDINFEPPVFKSAPLVSVDNYEDKESLLQQNDPKRHFLIETDAHDLERAKLDKPGTFMDKNVNYVYSTGRAHLEMTDEIKRYVEQKCKDSNGKYDKRENSYTNTEHFSNARAFNSGYCNVCGNVSDILCSRCSTFYCGTECQRKDWAQHRQVCLKKVLEQKALSMEKIDISLRMPPMKLELPKSGNLVTMTAVINSNLVFLRPKEVELDALYVRITNEVHMRGANCEKISTLPKCGQIVGVKTKGQFQRALVLKVHETSIKLVHMDYGNVEIATLDELYQIPREVQYYPRLVLPVLLKGVRNRYMIDSLREYMYSYLCDVNLVIKYESNDASADQTVYSVQLLNPVTNELLNDEINKLITPTPPGNDEYFLNTYLPEFPLPCGSHVELVVLDNSNLNAGLITCTKEEFACEIRKFEPDIQQYAESLKPEKYAPRVHELCIVRMPNSNKWFRACCAKLDGDGYPSVMLLDYGYIAKVDIADIRRYPAQFKFPLFAHDCNVIEIGSDGNKELSDMLLKHLTLGCKIQCDWIKHDTEEGTYQISLATLLEKYQIKEKTSKQNSDTNENKLDIVQ